MFKSAMLHLLNVHARYHLRSVVGKQLTSLYRYGHMSVCGPKLEEFKFCMSLKGLHPEERRDAWIRRRAEWWARRRLEKSSEDVWDIRTYVAPHLLLLSFDRAPHGCRFPYQRAAQGLPAINSLPARAKQYCTRVRYCTPLLVTLPWYEEPG